jgi:hypothetical protein
LTNGHSQGRDGAKTPGTYGEPETRELRSGRRVKSDFIVTVFSLFRGANGCRFENTVRGIFVLLAEGQPDINGKCGPDK